MLPLGIGVLACVWSATWSSWCGFTGQLTSLLPTDLACAYTHIHTLSRMRKIHSLSLWHFHFTRSLRTLKIYIRVSCAPPPTDHSTVSSGRSTPCFFHFHIFLLPQALYLSLIYAASIMKEPQRGANRAWAYHWGSDLGATLVFEVFRAAICVQSDSQGGAGVCFFLPLSA